MEAKNLRVITGTEDFMKGEMDNTTVINGQIVLTAVAGQYIQFGSYTSPAMAFPAFDALTMSWNADTPAGTVVESQVRVMVDGNWSGWTSFGRWSPFMERGNAAVKPRGPLSMPRDILYLEDKTAEQAQLRIYLYTDQEKASPAVRLLAASVRTLQPLTPPGSRKVANRLLNIPAYCTAQRAPALRPSMAWPAALAGMMNRWGEDVLPEELGMAMYDYTAHSCANIAFAAAVAGCWGYPAYLVWMDEWMLRREIHDGFAVLVRLRTPPLPGSDAKPHHWPVVVRGFVEDGGATFVLATDPDSPTDQECSRRYPLEEFLRQWDGVALLLHRHIRGGGWLKPARTAVSLKPEPDAPGLYRLFQGGSPLELADVRPAAPLRIPDSILAMTMADGIAHATTAHKHFVYPPAENGCIRLTPSEGTRVRHTVYVVDKTGAMLVGEILL